MKSELAPRTYPCRRGVGRVRPAALHVSLPHSVRILDFLAQRAIVVPSTDHFWRSVRMMTFVIDDPPDRHRSFLDGAPRGIEVPLMVLKRLAGWTVSDAVRYLQAECGMSPLEAWDVLVIIFASARHSGLRRVSV